MSDARFVAMGLMMEAVMAGQQGHYTRALDLLNQAIYLVPDNGELYHNRGMVYTRMEEYDRALSDFSRAIALSPHPGSFEQRGYVYKQIGDTEAARLDWEQVIEMDPSSTMALANLGYLLSQEGDIESCKRALALLDRSIESEPSVAQAYATRAEIYMVMGEPGKAFADMQIANHLIEQGHDTSNRDKLY